MLSTIQEKPNRRSFRLYILFLPAVALLAVMGWGLTDLVLKSFRDFDAFSHTEGALSLDNYRSLISSGLVRETVVRTIVMATVITVAALLLAIPFSYVVASVDSRLFRLFLITATFIPVLTGDITRTFAWLIVFGRQGLMASVASWVGIDMPDLLGTPFAVGLGSLQVMFPLAVLLLLPAYQRVPPEVEEAAATLGASARQRWIQVILPLIRPGIAAAAAVSFTVGMAEFASPALLGQGQFDYVSNLIESIVLGRDNLYLGSALGVSLLVIVLGVVTVISAFGTRRTVGAEK